VVSGFVRSPSSTKAISASTLGCSTRFMLDLFAVVERHVGVQHPEIGESTPSCFCTDFDVRPILRPTSRRPCFR
jgi:hypothetical protein